jgi:hypothetical protein
MSENSLFSEGRQELLDELKASYQELRSFLQSLTPIAWASDYGVRYKHSPITIKNSVTALISDYIHHRKEIEYWVAGNDADRNRRAPQ